VLVLKLTKEEDGTERRAEKAGVHIADRLIKINGEDVVPATATSKLANATYPLSLEFLRANVSYWKKIKALQKVKGAFKEMDPDDYEDGVDHRKQGTAWGGAAK
jgi:hypothetical protein